MLFRSQGVQARHGGGKSGIYKGKTRKARRGWNISLNYAISSVKGARVIRAALTNRDVISGITDLCFCSTFPFLVIRTEGGASATAKFVCASNVTRINSLVVYGVWRAAKAAGNKTVYSHV
jgi:hypothetical protein